MVLRPLPVDGYEKFEIVDDDRLHCGGKAVVVEQWFTLGLWESLPLGAAARTEYVGTEFRHRNPHEFRGSLPCAPMCFKCRGNPICTRRRRRAGQMEDFGGDIAAAMRSANFKSLFATEKIGVGSQSGHAQLSRCQHALAAAAG
jgi:hypothetical protein